MNEEELYDFPVANLRPYYKPPIIPSLRNRIRGLMAVTVLAFEHAQYYTQQADKTGRSAIDLWAEDLSYGRLPPTPSRSDIAQQEARKQAQKQPQPSIPLKQPQENKVDESRML